MEEWVNRQIHVSITHTLGEYEGYHHGSSPVCDVCLLPPLYHDHNDYWITGTVVTNNILLLPWKCLNLELQK